MPRRLRYCKTEDRSVSGCDWILALTMSTHPMVPVPQAIEIVLQRTAEVILSGNSGGTNNSKHLTDDDVIPMRTDDVNILGRVAVNNVIMAIPGYPPFPASIMDGYAIHVNNDTEGGEGGKDVTFKVCIHGVNESSVDENRSEESRHDQLWTHRIVGKIFAGEGIARECNREESIEETITPPHNGDAEQSNDIANHSLPIAMYITTGTVVPPQYNAIIPVETVIVSNNQRYIRLKNGSETTQIPKVGEWIRPVGCDIAPDTVLLTAGEEIGPSQIALLVQCGVIEILVRRLPKVGVLSTGNEIVSLPSTGQQHLVSPRTSSKSTTLTGTWSAEMVDAGKIYDSNRPVLLSLLSTFGVEAIDLGIATDEINVLESKLRDAFEQCDVVITSGGISQGDKDLLEHVLMECLGAKIHFGRLHMKPGKPTTFLTWMDKSTKGTTGASNSTKLIFALPGNPVSAIVCSHLVVHPALQLLRCGQLPGINTVQGMARNAAVQSEIDAVLAQDLKLDIERPEYHRVTLQWVSGNAAGQNRIGHFVARSTGVQRSSRLLSMRMADGLACLPQGIRGRKMACKKGETVLVLLLSNRYFAGGATMDVKWMESRHMAIQKRISVGILGRHLSLTQNDLERSVSSSLDRAQIMVTQMDVPVEQKGQFLNSLGADLSDVQLVVVVSGGGFRKDLDVSLAVYSALEKNADAMALHARKIAAADYWLSALFEVTIGWTMGKLVVCIPERGLTAALSSISGMVLHAINTGSGKR